ncbi:hypothetical protein [Xenorhabdus hominickii]|uniref:MmyB family transcriptional regulator n=1 Tax=Xenorhabdus hominickii TaxID=351679 RepID=UPI003003894A
MNQLLETSPEFNEMWHRHEIYEPCNGIRELTVNAQVVSFDYTSMIIDQERHLRMIVYAKN